MHSNDTIAAVASGWARSLRAIVRIAGLDAPDLLEDLFEPPLPGVGCIGRAVLRLPRADGASALPLPCMLMVYGEGRSFTGEPGAEIVLPGNPALLERVLACICSRPGVRGAGPGEFAARAFLSGRLTLDRAEGIAATIAARTAADLATARKIASGDAGARFRAWADEAATLLALVEAGIDFTDQEDVVPIAPGDLSRRLAALAGEIGSSLGAVSGREHESMMPAVVLVGRPNAGKSTLFNALLARRRAAVSPVAGTTRDVLREPLDLSADAPGLGPIMLIDLAGIDEVAGGGTGTDAEAQRAAREAIDQADIIIHCDPMGRFLDPLPVGGSTPPHVIRVRTKADQIIASKDSVSEIEVCAIDGYHLGALRRAIADAAWAGGGRAGTEVDPAAHLPRHRRALARARAALLRASAGLSRAELVAGELREALDALEELVGRISPDDIIGRVFATFCVGK